MTFTNWVNNFTKEESAIGNLARDIKDDTNWPSENDYFALRGYAFLHKDYGTQLVFRHAWREYERVNKMK